MRLTNLVPKFLRPVLRPIYCAYVSSWVYRKINYRPQSRDEIYQYWRKPWDGFNLPQDYLKGEVRSQFLVRIVKRYAKPNERILEIGCNVGRNLNYLFLAGFKELSGIEISESAVQLLKVTYPEMARHAKIYNAPAEEVLGELKDGEFDVVFTMAVLAHIHPESEWTFPEIVRITKKLLITIEDERGSTWGHFPRNYKETFEPLEMKQVKVLNCRDVEGLGSNFFVRAFKKDRE